MPIYVVTPKSKDKLFPGVVEHVSMVTAIRDMIDIGKGDTVFKDPMNWKLEYKERWLI